MFQEPISQTKPQTRKQKGGLLAGHTSNTLVTATDLAIGLVNTSNVAND